MKTLLPKLAEHPLRKSCPLCGSNDLLSWLPPNNNGSRREDVNGVVKTVFSWHNKCLHDDCQFTWVSEQCFS